LFIGHYGPAFAAQAIRRSPSLMAGFVAVQLVDIGFFSLAYFGVENWRPNPSIAGIMPVDLYYMPYTHSLLGATVWALTAGALACVLAPKGRRLLAATVISSLVVSHWLLDLVVHRHDLGLMDNEPDKLGFGLWDHPFLEMPLELALLFAGLWVYVKSTHAHDAWGRRLIWVVPAVLLILQSINWFAPPPADKAVFSGLGLVAYTVCALMAWFLDRTRRRNASPALRYQASGDRRSSSCDVTILLNGGASRTFSVRQVRSSDGRSSGPGRACVENLGPRFG